MEDDRIVRKPNNGAPFRGSPEKSCAVCLPQDRGGEGLTVTLLPRLLAAPYHGSGCGRSDASFLSAGSRTRRGHGGRAVSASDFSRPGPPPCEPSPGLGSEATRSKLRRRCKEGVPPRSRQAGRGLGTQWRAATRSREGDRSGEQRRAAASSLGRATAASQTACSAFSGLRRRI